MDDSEDMVASNDRPELGRRGRWRRGHFSGQDQNARVYWHSRYDQSNQKRFVIMPVYVDDQRADGSG